MKTPFLALLLLLLPLTAHSERLKDLAQIEGVRSNTLVGYGLVVGLPGTGEQTSYTEQSFRTFLTNFGITLPSGTRPKIKNVAAVAISAELPAFAKPGQKIDITVSSVGNAESLRGGTLLQTFLKGVDGKVYAVAQGNLAVGGFGFSGEDGSKVVANTPTVGRIPNGAVVEREVPQTFGRGDFLTFNLNRGDFSTAQRVADAINDLIGPDTAAPIDATSIRVLAPRDVSQRVAYLSTLENIEVEPADESAKVIVNARTGTIVIGKNVRLYAAAVTHGGMTVTIAETQQVSQPNPLSQGQTVVTPQSIVDVVRDDARMFVFNPGSTLDELVQAVNAVGAAPGDIIAILEALREAGALRGELVII